MDCSKPTVRAGWPDQNRRRAALPAPWRLVDRTYHKIFTSIASQVFCEIARTDADHGWFGNVRGNILHFWYNRLANESAGAH
jgi:hypothetical protein